MKITKQNFVSEMNSKGVVMKNKLWFIFLLNFNDHVHGHVLCSNYGKKLHCFYGYRFENQRILKTCKQRCQGKQEKMEKFNCRRKNALDEW